MTDLQSLEQRPDFPAALFERYEGASRLLLAVSGGPDSMALLRLVRRWADADAGRPALVAATVDHGLRPESRREAEQVAAWCRALGVAHRILVWDGPKPDAAVQEKAREARYGLLVDCAQEIGAAAILTGHHADDQAETVLFRLLRGSGVTGLSGMAEIGVYGGMTIGRPLLGLRKAELIGVCETANQPYFDDPSNSDEKFARARIRKAAGLFEQFGFGVEEALRLQRRAARADAALARAADDLAAAAILARDETSARFRLPVLADAPEEIILRVLTREIGRISGRLRFRLDRAEDLVSKAVAAVRSGERLCATFGGAVIELKDQVCVVRKENRRTGIPSGQSELRKGDACKSSNEEASSLGKQGRDA